MTDSLEKQIRKALLKHEKFTLWKVKEGWQANAMAKGSSGWTIAIDPDPMTAIKEVLGISVGQDEFDDLA